jgi:hypothetical protein
MPAPVELVLVRGLLPDVGLKPGTILTGRVLDASTLLLAGVRLAAKLPAGVEPGQHLRLKVAEASTERIHLQVVEQQAPQAAAAQPAPPSAAVYAMALPGGVAARVHVEEREEAGRRGEAGAARAVVVRYDSPTLGRMDVRIDRSSAAVHVSAGEPADRVRGAAEVLREALARVTGGPVQVTVHPREETLDVRA